MGTASCEPYCLNYMFLNHKVSNLSNYMLAINLCFCTFSLAAIAKEKLSAEITTEFLIILVDN